MITIVFRGVGVFVPGVNDTVREVLFPNAETLEPPNHEKGQSGDVKHADKSKARKHYTGALILDKDDNPEYRKLIGRRVDFPLANATEAGAGFASAFPSLPLATHKKPLRLLPEKQWESNRVGTRIVLRGGTLDAPVPTKGFKFEVPGDFGTAVSPRFFAAGALWTTDAEKVVIKVKKFGADEVERDIVLNEDRPLAFFYSFDIEFPTSRELTGENPERCNRTTIDHDFKWTYQLMNRKDTSLKRWQDWLGKSKKFPAPKTNCVPSKSSARNIVLVPVSTCYSTVWDGEIDP